MLWMLWELCRTVLPLTKYTSPSFDHLLHFPSVFVPPCLSLSLPASSFSPISEGRPAFCLKVTQSIWSSCHNTWSNLLEGRRCEETGLDSSPLVTPDVKTLSRLQLVVVRILKNIFLMLIAFKKISNKQMTWIMIKLSIPGAKLWRGECLSVLRVNKWIMF